MILYDSLQGAVLREVLMDLHQGNGARVPAWACFRIVGGVLRLEGRGESLHFCRVCSMICTMIEVSINPHPSPPQLFLNHGSNRQGCCCAGTFCLRRRLAVSIAHVQGNLKGYDHTINLVLEGCSERIYSQARGVEQARIILAEADAGVVSEPT